MFLTESRTGMDAPHMKKAAIREPIGSTLAFVNRRVEGAMWGSVGYDRDES